MRVAVAVLGAGLLAYVLVMARRRTMTGDMEAPMDLERHRAKSEAEMAAPVSEADDEDAAELVAYVEKIGTGELPLVVAFDADPLGAPIPEDRYITEPEHFNDVTAHWLSLFTWSPSSTVPLTSVQVSEPPPFELESFTQGWTTADVERMVAEAKAEASR